MKKVAFLFLIYDKINLEELWAKFFEHVDRHKYSIYIHYKFNIPSKYFEQYKLSNCIETKYADVSLVRAQNVLLSEALKDNDNQHFIFVSNSCIPFKNFDTIYNSLSTDKSYFNLAPHNHCFPRCDSLLPYLRKEQIQKASQWCILNRKHGHLMTDDTTYTDMYKSIYAPDEICYITNIYVNNLQDEIVTTPNVANDATTFTNWEGMLYKYPSLRGLKNYNFITEDEILHLISSKCLFGRKFNQSCLRCFCIKPYLDLFTNPFNHHI
jgi:hypothetical protein